MTAVGTGAGDLWNALIKDSGIIKIETFETASIDLTTIAANAAATTTFVRHDVNIGDIVVASPKIEPDTALTWSAAVLAKDTISLRLGNNSASAVDPAAGTWNILVIKLQP